MSFRGGAPRGRGGGFAPRGGRGGFRGGRGGGGGGFYNDGPPAEVLEMGTMVHAVEGEMLVASTNSKVRCERSASVFDRGQVPYFNAPIFLENKSSVGKVDEILGPINEVYFTVKMAEGMVATSFSKGDKLFIGSDRLLPLERFLPKPKPPPGTKVEKRGRGRGGARGGDRGGFRGRGAPGGRGAPRGRGGPGGFAPRGRGFAPRGAPRGRGGFGPPRGRGRGS